MGFRMYSLLYPNKWQNLPGFNIEMSNIHQLEMIEAEFKKIYI